MLTTLTPGSAASQDTAWANPSNALVVDGSVSVNATEADKVLKLTNCSGGPIGLTRSIIGFKVQWVGRMLNLMQSPSIETSYAVEVALTKDGSTPCSDWKWLEGFNVLTTHELGTGVEDLWGMVAAPTPTEVNASTFGVLFRRPSAVDPVDGFSQGAGERAVDGATILVYHNPGGSSFDMVPETGKHQVLIGKEVTQGTAVPATIRLRSTKLEPMPQFDIQKFVPQGEKGISDANLIKEWSEVALSGQATFDEMVYALQMFICKAESGGAAVLAQKNIHTMRVDPRERDVLQTYSLEYLDMLNDKARAVAFLYGQRLEIGITRDGITMSGSALARKQSDLATPSAGANEVQTLTFTGATYGFKLVWKGKESSALSQASNAAAFQAALRTLTGSSTLTVTGTGPFVVTFLGSPVAGEPQAPLQFRLTSGTGSMAVVRTTYGGFTEIDPVPLVPGQVDVFIADDYDDLAAGQLDYAFMSSIALGPRGTPFFVLDSSLANNFKNYAEPAGGVPITFNLKLAADSDGVAMLANMRANSRKWIRVKFTGPVIGVTSDVHTLTFECPFKVVGGGPYGDENNVYALEYQLEGSMDRALNEYLTVIAENGVVSF